MSLQAVGQQRSLKAHLAQGHSETGQPVPGWDDATLAGAGALRSDALDMMKFIAANLAPPTRGLPALFANLRRPRINASPTLAVGLAYHIDSRFGHPIVWHNGGTGGFRSFMGYDTAARYGVVVLTNSAADADDIGFHLLDARYELEKPPAAHKEIAVDRAILERYVGVYEFRPTLKFAVTLDADGLWGQGTDQAKVRLRPESDSDFYVREADATIRFLRDPSGRVTGLMLHQAGRDIPAKLTTP